MRHGATAVRFLDAEVAVFEEGTQPFGLELRAGGPGAAEGHSSPVLGVPDIGFRCSRHDGSPSEIVFCCIVTRSAGDDTAEGIAMAGSGDGDITIGRESCREGVWL